MGKDANELIYDQKVEEILDHSQAGPMDLHLRNLAKHAHSPKVD